jgi:hypothetical protein
MGGWREPNHLRDLWRRGRVPGLVSPRSTRCRWSWSCRCRCRYFKVRMVVVTSDQDRPTVGEFADKLLFLGLLQGLAPPAWLPGVAWSLGVRGGGRVGGGGGLVASGGSSVLGGGGIHCQWKRAWQQTQSNIPK